MGSGWKVVRLGAWLTAALALGACGGEDDDGTPGSEGGAGGAAAGSGNVGTAGAGALSGGGAGGSAGSAGTTGESAEGGSGTGASGGSFGTGGTTGGGAGTGGSSGEDAKECTLASTEGLTYSGTCLYADHCSDQYDTAFGPALLEQACVAQSGTWSTTPCNPADWEILCTQAVLGGVYLQYMRDDGGCILGCEEKL
jgi:hypothetical protein